jgi:sugar/nucleoside kinase (ribokinase family)
VKELSIRYDAVIAGYTCVDLFPQFNKNRSSADISDLLKPGKLIEIDGLDFVLGGVVPNTGLAMRKFNKNVFLNGLVGNDIIGKMVKEYLAQYDMSEGIETTEAAGTAFSIVLAPPGVDRIFLESPGCNKIFDAAFINFDVISNCRIFHFGYPPLLRQFYLNNGRQLSEMFSKVRKMEIVTSLDFSLPDPDSESGKVNWPEIMRDTFPFVDIFVPSLEEVVRIMMPRKYAELQSLSGNSDIADKIPVDLIREAGKLIIDSGVKVLVIKAGSRGAYLRTGNISSMNKNLGPGLNEKDWNDKELFCNAYHAESSRIVNASGAGDTSAAAFLSAVLDGHSPELALKYAAIAGRNSLYCHNIFSDISDWQNMTEEIKSEDNEIICF